MDAPDRVRRIAGIVALLAAAGCASIDSLQIVRSPMQPAELACVGWYASLDAAVASAGVGDAQAARVAGFPYLRTDRFSSALRESARSDAETLEALAERLAVLDLEARGHEISNLSHEQRRKLVADDAPAQWLLKRTRECSRLLRHVDLERPGLRGALLDRLQVPDDYVTGYRIAGMYALAKVPFSAGVRRQIKETRASFVRDLARSSQGIIRRYAPPGESQPTAAQVRSMLSNATLNSLRVPEPRGDDLQALFDAYAPVFEVETTGGYDLPGALRWSEARLAEVDASRPAVYVQAAHTRYHGVNLLQLVYTIWFSERPARSAVDILAGRLDGVVFRVTLAQDGTPLVYDTIHPCGCYHMFLTTPRAHILSAPADEPEWAFVPQTLPAVALGDRVVVRVASGTHYVERVLVETESRDTAGSYELRPYDDLRSLPHPRGGKRSVFGPDGMIAGTERPESWLFWPMGIANAGAMRQWGHHATAFVGRRHFDDANLLERRFELKLQ